MGIRWISITADKGASCELVVRSELLNPFGSLHGGVIYSLVDFAMGAPILAGLDPGYVCGTLQLSITYHRSVRSGMVCCESRVLHRGSRSVSLTAEVQVEGRPVASALGTFAIHRAGHAARGDSSDAGPAEAG